MTFSIKAELNAMMNGAFALHAFIKPHFSHQIDRALLEHASANRRFYVFSATSLENDRIDPFFLRECPALCPPNGPICLIGLGFEPLQLGYIPAIVDVWQCRVYAFQQRLCCSAYVGCTL